MDTFKTAFVSLLTRMDFINTLKKIGHGVDTQRAENAGRMYF
jgi:hypothetical protein